MLRLTLRDLQFRATRFALVIAGTSVVFALLLLIGGMASFFSLEPVHAVDSIGADAWVLPRGMSGPFTSAGALDPTLASKVAGVKRADPLVVGRAPLEGSGVVREVVMIGHAPGGVGSPRVIEGRAAAQPGEAVVDERAAVKTGATIRIGGTPYLVTGRTTGATVLAGLPFAFVTLRDAQFAIFDGRAIVTAIVTKGTPSGLPEDVALRSPEDVIADTRAPLKDATKSIALMGGLLWIVSAMIIGGVVYLSSMERRRDFAVLKAVGAETRTLLAGVAAQSVLVALVASGLAAGLQALIVPTFPLPVHVAASSMLRLPVVAVTVALLASAAGMRRVANTDPSAAFAAQGA